MSGNYANWLGVGVKGGGSGGLYLIFVYNCMNPQNLHQKNDASWSINIPLGAMWSDVVKVVEKTKLFQIAPKLAEGIWTPSEHLGKS